MPCLLWKIQVMLALIYTSLCSINIANDCMAYCDYKILWSNMSFRSLNSKKRKNSWRNAILENIENVINGAITNRAQASLQPQFSRANPTIGMSTGDKRCAFVPLHAHAAHFINSTSSFFFNVPFETPLLISAVRFLKQSHQRLQLRRGVNGPVSTLRGQRCSEVHVSFMGRGYGLFAE